MASAGYYERSKFANHSLTVKFQPVSLTWDKGSLLLTGAELVPEITFRGTPVDNHHLFLNEARLSAIGTCLFLAGVHLSDNDHANPAHLRILVMDDALIGLELENRLPILKILTSESFKNYQIVLLTYDRVWFDLARGYLREADGWLHRELLADESTGKLIPRQKPSESDIQLARTHLANGDLMAAAVHARAALEWKLRNICENCGIEVKFKKDNRKITIDDLWRSILARQRKREELRKTTPSTPDFLPPDLETDVEVMRSTILNALSHARAPGLVRAEVLAAIQTAERVKDHPFK